MTRRLRSSGRFGAIGGRTGLSARAGLSAGRVQGRGKGASFITNTATRISLGDESTESKTCRRMSDLQADGQNRGKRPREPVLSSQGHGPTSWRRPRSLGSWRTRAASAHESDSIRLADPCSAPLFEDDRRSVTGASCDLAVYVWTVSGRRRPRRCRGVFVYEYVTTE